MAYQSANVAHSLGLDIVPRLYCKADEHLTLKIIVTCHHSGWGPVRWVNFIITWIMQRQLERHLEEL